VGTCGSLRLRPSGNSGKHEEHCHKQIKHTPTPPHDSPLALVTARIERIETER
jgi:hypothetical protein